MSVIWTFETVGAKKTRSETRSKRGPKPPHTASWWPSLQLVRFLSFLRWRFIFFANEVSWHKGHLSPYMSRVLYVCNTPSSSTSSSDSSDNWEKRHALENEVTIFPPAAPPGHLFLSKIKIVNHLAFGQQLLSGTFLDVKTDGLVYRVYKYV